MGERQAMLGKGIVPHITTEHIHVIRKIVRHTADHEKVTGYALGPVRNPDPALLHGLVAAVRSFTEGHPVLYFNGNPPEHTADPKIIPRLKSAGFDAVIFHLIGAYQPKTLEAILRQASRSKVEVILGFFENGIGSPPIDTLYRKVVEEGHTKFSVTESRLSIADKVKLATIGVTNPVFFFPSIYPRSSNGAQYYTEKLMLGLGQNWHMFIGPPITTALSQRTPSAIRNATEQVVADIFG